VFLAGCAVSHQSVPIPNLSAKLDDPAKARIYVLYPPTGYINEYFIDSGQEITISDGDKFIGWSEPHGFLCWERPPGRASIMLRSNTFSQLDLEVKAGEVYYVVTRMTMELWKNRYDLELVNETTGSYELSRCSSPKLESASSQVKNSSDRP